MTKQTFKVGDKVRILDASKIDGGSDYWKDGDVYEVVNEDRQDIYVVAPGSLNGYWYVTKGTETPYIEKVSDKPTKNQRIAALEQAQVSLEQQVETLLRRVEALENGTSYTHTPRLSVKEVEPVSANQARKAIIDEAKAFVEKVTEHIGRHHSREIKGYGRLNDVGNEWILCPYFEVKSEKREVTVVLKTRTHGKLQSKGIAKCAPDDVFNADIGKAIALGRALGLDVTRFEQAVQPTELVIGMVVEDIDDDFPIAHGKVAEIEPKDCQGQRGYRTDKGFYAYLTHAKILDDTEAQY